MMLSSVYNEAAALSLACGARQGGPPTIGTRWIMRVVYKIELLPKMFNSNNWAINLTPGI